MDQKTEALLREFLGADNGSRGARDLLNDLSRAFQDHESIDAERHEKVLIAITERRVKEAEHERRICDLEKVEEITGVKNVEELKGALKEARSELKTRGVEWRGLLYSVISGTMVALVLWIASRLVK